MSKQYGNYQACLYLIAKFSDNDITYKKWFSLSAWCSVPAIFTALAGWLVIITAGGLIEMTAINPLNLNFLLFKSEGEFAGWLSSLNLITIWSAVLLVLGYKIFTSCSTTKASIVVLTPYMLILAIWAAIIII